MKNLTFTTVFLLLMMGVSHLSSQNVFPASGSTGIGTLTPNASALLDVQSNTQGILIPRMTKAQRDAIAVPATGLMIYQTNSQPGFYFFNGSAWSPVTPKGANTSLSNLTATSINQSLIPVSDLTFDLGSLTKRWEEGYIGTIRFADGSFQNSAPVPYTGGVGINVTGPTISLNNTGVTSGTYGSSSTVPQIQIDDQGRIISAIDIEIAVPGVGANLNLSNLNTTSINQSLLPNFYGVQDIGSSSLPWNNIEALEIKAANSFYLGGSKIFHITGDNNTFLGYLTGSTNTTGGDNTFLGDDAGSSNTTGSNNTFVGQAAGDLNDVGFNNSFLGASAGEDNTDGEDNTFLGYGAGRNNTTSSFNTYVGAYAGYNSDLSAGNTFIGQTSGYANTLGDDNTFVGQGAGYDNIDGWENTLIGNGSGDNITTGDENVCLGEGSGDNINTGNENTMIGDDADVTSSSFSNSTALGNLASATASNQVRIGNSSVSSIGGYTSWTNISDERFKSEIKANVAGLEFITKLKPVTYTLNVSEINNLTNPNWKNEISQNGMDAIAAKEAYRQIGFLAQEVEDAAQSINFEFSGVDIPKNENDFYGLRYAEFVVPLVKAVQELDSINKSNDEIIGNLQNQINELRNLVLLLSNQSPTDSFKTGIDLNNQTSSCWISQNAPNPFSGETVIKCYIPVIENEAKIIFYSNSGSVVDTYLITNSGSTEVNINSMNLTSGNYSYSLIVDGELIDTKKMTVLK